MKLAVIGSINMDQVITADRIPHKGETLQGHEIRYVPGGKGANQAVAMARLKAEVSMFGCVGDDANGTALLQNLKDNGVDTSHIRVLSGVPTGLAAITVAEQDNVIVIISGANAQVDTSYIDDIAPKLPSYDLVVLQHEIPLETVHYAVHLCHAQGIPVVLNPAPAAKVPMDIVEEVTCLTPNEHEAGLIFSDEEKEPALTDSAIEELLRRYPEKLIITRGARGVSACTKDGDVVTVPARKVPVVDTTGAGDTLNGAFCVRLAAGDSLQEALMYANAAAALSIQKFGAQSGMPTAEEVSALLKQTA